MKTVVAGVGNQRMHVTSLFVTFSTVCQNCEVVTKSSLRYCKQCSWNKNFKCATCPERLGDDNLYLCFKCSNDELDNLKSKRINELRNLKETFVKTVKHWERRPESGTELYRYMHKLLAVELQRSFGKDWDRFEKLNATSDLSVEELWFGYHCRFKEVREALEHASAHYQYFDDESAVWDILSSRIDLQHRSTFVLWSLVYGKQDLIGHRIDEMFAESSWSTLFGHYLYWSWSKWDAWKMK
jgi:hypothetical protein